MIVAVALSGPALVIGTGSIGGWEPFGPERLVTRAEGTMVYELDGERALDTYRRYLGKLADELPGARSSSRWPSPRPMGACWSCAPSMASTMTSGRSALPGTSRKESRAPDARHQRRAAGRRPAGGARRRAALGDVSPGAVICISCVGRRAVLRSRIGEEIDEVGLLAEGATVSGFYSNGESPLPRPDVRGPSFTTRR